MLVFGFSFQLISLTFIFEFFAKRRRADLVPLVLVKDHKQWVVGVLGPTGACVDKSGEFLVGEEEGVFETRARDALVAHVQRCGNVVADGSCKPLQVLDELSFLCQFFPECLLI